VASFRGRGYESFAVADHYPLTTVHCFQSLAPFINSLENIPITYKDFRFAGDSGGVRVGVGLRLTSGRKVSRTGLEMRSAAIVRGAKKANFALETIYLGTCYQ
jgi:hypothetical protein